MYDDRQLVLIGCGMAGLLQRGLIAVASNHDSLPMSWTRT